MIAINLLSTIVQAKHTEGTERTLNSISAIACQWNYVQLVRTLVCI